MGLGLKMKMQMQSHHSVPVALRMHEQAGSQKRKYTFIQAHRAWLPKFLLLWILLMALFGWFIYNRMDADTKVRRKEVLGSLCDQRARMLQDQFSVSVNHVHALAILVSTFHYYRNPSAIDQVCALISVHMIGYLGIFTFLFMVLIRAQSSHCVCMYVVDYCSLPLRKPLQNIQLGQHLKGHC